MQHCVDRRKALGGNFADDEFESGPRVVPVVTVTVKFRLVEALTGLRLFPNTCLL